MNDQQTRDEIETILDWFDFERVKSVMEFLNWQWHNCETPTGIPGIPELRKRARNLIFECIANMKKNKELDRSYCIETGGFRVKTYQYDEEKIYIKLDFNLTSWDNYD